ncbi:MAG: HEPN domain-containing protein [Polyangiaceae bacterium]|nr:HEPN domain-containing protein [Polyangiaceae bacterium]
MTRQNRRKTAATELRRAQQAMRAADALARDGLYNDATSRAYYAVFHAACALLARLDVHARTHRGVESLLAERLVAAGRLTGEDLLRFSRVQSQRNIADYGADEDITAEQMSVILADARAFLDTALEVQGSLPD